MNNRFMRKLAGITLGLSIMATGAAALAPTSTYAAVSSSTTAANVIATGQKFMGVPYQWGAQSGRTDRFDCSSFVQYSFAQNGIHLPRSSRQQSTVGTFVPRDQLQPGDLVFFYSPIHHVAIYMGNGKLLHTYGAPGVTITDLNSGWWSSHYTTARRVLPTGQASPVVTAPSQTPVVTQPAPAVQTPVVSQPADQAPVVSKPAAPAPVVSKPAAPAPGVSKPAVPVPVVSKPSAPAKTQKSTVRHHHSHHHSEEQEHEHGHQD
ncbi:MAG: hydrolase [Cohnella sp.]|nr:hydrolase [Cohnella sp.]